MWRRVAQKARKKEEHRWRKAEEEEENEEEEEKQEEEERTEVNEGDARRQLKERQRVRESEPSQLAWPG